MSIDDYSSRLKQVGVLYVDVFPYRIGMDGHPEYLALRRCEDVPLPGTWQPVSGKIQEGERIRDAFVRLIRVKTGIDVAELHRLDTVNMFYDDYYDTVMVVPCAAARLCDGEVKTNSDYHTEYVWHLASDANDYLEWPNQLRCIEEIELWLSRDNGFPTSRELRLAPRK